jgi:hypothetical protein
LREAAAGLSVPGFWHPSEVLMARDALKKLSRRRPLLGELIESVVDIQTDTDRGAALIAGSMLENALEDALQTLMRENMEPDELSDIFGRLGFLSTFSAKITAGYAFRLYGKQTKADLEIVKDIRNAFAHSSIRVAFDTESVRSATESIKFLERLKMEFGKPWPPATARGKFTQTCHHLGIALMSEASHMSLGETSVLP